MDAKSYAARNRQGSNWFSHADEPQAVNKLPATQPIINPTVEGDNAGSVSRTQIIKPVCNSNQWYKYDNTPTNATSGDEVKSNGISQQHAVEQVDQIANSKDKSPDHHHVQNLTPTKPGSPLSADAGSTTEHSQQHRPKNVTKEGQANCQRDKSGSDWFSHERPNSGAASQTPRCGAEGSQNASRMRAESENWFNHDSKNLQAQGHVGGKGRNKPADNGQMHGIFHQKE